MLIAGLDPSACAGLAADLKTCMSLDAYGLPVITAATAQNTQQVTAVYPVESMALRGQIETLLSDVQIDAVKIGLLTEADQFQIVHSILTAHRLTNIVVDPVLRSTTGFSFGNDQALKAYKELLFPVADVITPNLDEAAAFTGIEVNDVSSMKLAASRLHDFGPRNVVITGGHLAGAAVDVLFDGKGHHLFEAPKIEPVTVRGLGCTFSTLLAIHLANQKPLPQAIPAAKEFIGRAMQYPLKFGHGRGALNHRAG